MPRELGDGVRQLRLLVERRPAHLAGRSPARPVDSGRGVAAGRSGHGAGRRRLRRRLADRQRLLRERRARRRVGRARSSPPSAGRNEIFSYQPDATGAGFALDRRAIFITSNVEAAVRRVGLHRWADDQRHGARSRRSSGRRTSPSAPTARCTSATGSIRASAATRIWTTRCRARSTGSRRRGSCRKSPAFDAATIDGLITALRSPAVNVRAIGFEGLKARGAAAVNAVAALLNDPNPYMRGRAIFLLYQLGPEGRQRAGAPESQTDPAMRIAAYRAMRRAGLDVMPVAAVLARDTDPGVRREVALSHARPARGRGARHPRRHRARLRRSRIAATSKRSAPAPPARRRRSTSGCGASSASGDPLAWSNAFARIAWRLHVPAAVDALAARAGATELSLGRAQLAMDTLAFIDDPRRVGRRCSRSPRRASPLREPATWWLLNRMSNDWADHDLQPALKQRRIYDPDTITLQSIVRSRRATRPHPRSRSTRSPRSRGCGARQGRGHALPDVPRARRRRRRGRTGARRLGRAASRRGHRHGHRRSGRRRSRTATTGTSIRTKDGLTIQGLLIKEGDPLMMRSMGGVTQIIPADRVTARAASARDR